MVALFALEVCIEFPIISVEYFSERANTTFFRPSSRYLLVILWYAALTMASSKERLRDIVIVQGNAGKMFP